MHLALCAQMTHLKLMHICARWGLLVCSLSHASERYKEVLIYKELSMGSMHELSHGCLDAGCRHKRHCPGGGLCDPPEREGRAISGQGRAVPCRQRDARQPGSRGAHGTLPPACHNASAALQCCTVTCLLSSSCFAGISWLQKMQSL